MKIFGMGGGTERPRGYEAYLRKQQLKARAIGFGVALLVLLVGMAVYLLVVT